MGLRRPVTRDDGPTIIGRYALYDKIGGGGMATVHLGRLLGPVGFSRTVAIKRMLPQFVADHDFVSMFVDEARLASRIRHPNVVPTLDVVAEVDELFLVLEYVHGDTLSQLIKAVSAKGQRIPPSFAATIVCGLLHGLQAAHDVKDERGDRLGVVHRDVSPQNVLVGTDGAPRLLDFGVAKAAGRLQITTKGQIKGKLAYMAPEHARGTASPQSDIYAASAVLWEALTCRRLFENVTWQNISQAIMQREVVAPSAIVPALPKSFDEIVLRGLAKDPTERFQSAREMALAIENCIRLASAHEVGEWVEKTAATVLAERVKLIAAIENDAAGQPSVAVGRESAPRPVAESMSSETVTRRENQHSILREKTTEDDPSSQTPFTQTSNPPVNDPPHPPPRPNRRAAALAVALAIAASALVAIAVRRNGRDPASGHAHETALVGVSSQPVTSVASAHPLPPPEPTGIPVTALPEETRPANPASATRGKHRPPQPTHR